MAGDWGILCMYQWMRPLWSGLHDAVRTNSLESWRWTYDECHYCLIHPICTTSDGESAPRGLDFLLDPNRLNVAISRAQWLSIVVGCPDLVAGISKSVANVRQISLFCNLMQSGSFFWSLLAHASVNCFCWIFMKRFIHSDAGRNRITAKSPGLYGYMIRPRACHRHQPAIRN